MGDDVNIDSGKFLTFFHSLIEEFEWNDILCICRIL